jgi:hypothetical protein
MRACFYFCLFRSLVSAFYTVGRAHHALAYIGNVTRGSWSELHSPRRIYNNTPPLSSAAFIIGNINKKAIGDNFLCGSALRIRCRARRRFLLKGLLSCERRSLLSRSSNPIRLACIHQGRARFYCERPIIQTQISCRLEYQNAMEKRFGPWHNIVTTNRLFCVLNAG